MVACTSQSAATSVRRKGIEFRSTGADMPGKLHLCQTCSRCVRRHKTRGLPFAATTRTTGNGCVGRMAPALAQPRAQAQWWEYRSSNSYSGLDQIVAKATTYFHRPLTRPPSTFNTRPVPFLRAIDCPIQRVGRKNKMFGSTHRRPWSAFVVLVALASIGVPASGQDVDADQRQTATPIKHVIVLIGENRTFDHVFATYVPRSG